MWDPYAALRYVQLPNGLSVYLGTWNRPWVKMKIVVHAGGKDDPEGKDGVAHFLEHLLIENVDGLTREQASKYFDEIGGSIMFGSTSYNATNYKCSIPFESDNLKFSLNLLGKMLITCDIKQFVEREREVIINEYKERFPTHLQAEILTKKRKLFFSGRRLGTFLRSFGKLETIPIITLEDIRQFYTHYYTPANISIVAVGGIELEQFIAALQASPFGADKPGGRITLPVPMVEIDRPAETHWNKRATELTKLALHQSVIELYTAIPGIINRKAIAIAHNVLNVTFHREIRERHGLTYGFNVSWCQFPEAYEFSVVGKFPWESLNAIENLIDRSIGIALKRTDIIEQQIRASVNSYKICDPNAEMVVNNSSDNLAEQGHIETYSGEIALAKSVTVEEIQSILSQFNRERRFTMILRP